MESSLAIELAKITYLDPDAIEGRMVLLMPFWDGTKWHIWIPTDSGSFIKMEAIDAVHSNYVAKEAAAETDLWIYFVDIMWQRANWPEIGRTIQGIENYFHLLATSVAKIRFIFEQRESIKKDIVGSFVQTELEYIITTARSVFNLLQEALAKIWHSRIQLLNPEKDAIRKQKKMPDSFTKMAIDDRKTPKSIEYLMSQYALPQAVAAEYNRYAPFFLSLLKARDRVIHSGGNEDSIFVTEKGFCVNPKSRTFESFQWQDNHHYNENVVSLLPWVTHVVFGTIEACNDIMGSFASEIQLLPEMAPGYRVFIRDPASTALAELAEVAAGRRIWWSREVLSNV